MVPVLRQDYSLLKCEFDVLDRDNKMFFLVPGIVQVDIQIVDGFLDVDLSLGELFVS